MGKVNALAYRMVRAEKERLAGRTSWDVTSRKKDGSSGQNDRTTARDDVTCPNCQKSRMQQMKEVCPP